MNFEQFKEHMKKMVEQETGRAVEVTEVMKNNHKVFTGLTLAGGKKGEMKAVTYLEYYFEEYLQGESLEKVLKHIMDAINSTDKLGIVDVDFVSDYDEVKNQIVYRVVNAEANQEFLDGVPHEKVLDLAKVYYINIAFRNGTKGMLTISNHIFQLWNVTLEEMAKTAEENTKRLLPAVIRSVEEILLQLWKRHNELEPDIEIFKEMCEEISRRNKPVMYTLTNKTECQGAGTMFYPGVIKQFAESRNCDLIIIPSSIHETLLVKYSEKDVSITKKMIREVNETEMEAEEVLSNNVYVYRRANDKIEIA